MVLVETLEIEALLMAKIEVTWLSKLKMLKVSWHLEEHAEHGYLSHVAPPPPPFLARQPHTSGSGKGAHSAMLV